MIDKHAVVPWVESIIIQTDTLASTCCTIANANQITCLLLSNASASLVTSQYSIFNIHYKVHSPGNIRT